MRTCGHKEPKYKVIQKQSSVCDRLEILVCDKCGSRSPFNDSRLERELISQ